MKRKGIFIAAGIGLVLLVAGILIYISIKNPEALTKAPIDEPTQGEVDNLPPAEGVTETPSVGSSTSTGGSASVTQQPKESAGRCLVTTEANCSKSFITNFVGGTKNTLVGFSNLSSDVTIFSPIDGYVHFYESKNDPAGLGNMLAVATTESWSPDQSNNDKGDRAIFFFSYGVQPLIFGSVKKGDPIGKFDPSKAVMDGLIKDKAELVVSPDAKWGEAVKGADVVEYMSQMAQVIKN